MYRQNELKNLLFLDIETARQFRTLDELRQSNHHMYDLWLLKARRFKKERPDSSDEEIYQDVANLYPEFAKIVTIGMGFIHFKMNEDNTIERVKRVTSITNDDETIVLTKFLESFKKFGQSIGGFHNVMMCGHNLAYFDLPFIVKRCIITNIKLPQYFILRNKKPWEVSVEDTMHVWRFNSTEQTSLELLTAVLGLSNPKDVVKNYEVPMMYWSEDGDHQEALRLIDEYCQKDVLATIDVVLKLTDSIE
jgi:3'-5' exonuclease